MDAQRLGSAGQQTSSILNKNKRRANFGVARLDGGVDKVATLVVRKEDALHGVDGKSLKIVEAETEGVGSGGKFFGHGSIAHEPVVSVEGEPEFCLIKDFEGMLREATGSACMHVADEADFERDALIENVRPRGHVRILQTEL